jgi:beta-ribofuranosylaminobenzene 5'-phosphate synthase
MDMGNVTSRTYGGAGFALSSPATEIIAERSSGRTEIAGLEMLDADAQAGLRACVNRWAQLNKSAHVHIKIHRLPIQHIGLGTKTSLLMGTLAAATLAAGKEISQSAIQTLSGRGGASGVGVNTFFHGGFVADAGHPARKDLSFAPSSRRISHAVPPILSRVPIPERWQVYLFLPSGRRFSGNAEQEFFTKNTPIRRSEVLDSIALLYHGVVPAVLTADLSLLKESLANLHKVGFKKRELAAQSEDVKAIIAYLDSIRDCAVGLSSMGPLIYAISERTISAEVEDIKKTFNVDLLATCSGRNRGFEVQR